ncbi:hypothetical protein GDO86_020360 [Hymenochirus boettgeri]|uniref:DUF4515 domain-containing protein n=1 Tax=Hymenochirus boettgeri TaxID=247094 RepID=A0A8T2IKA6_9PIPI|nr:hypothetical protein GDO86_020360 [Hymenochirus boettgeri]
MPPKQKVPKKGENKTKNDAPAEEKETVLENKERIVSEKELQLQGEHNQLAAEQEGLRKRLEKLRKENEFLQEEAERVRIESQEYLSYMSKRSQRGEDVIVSLSDQNQRDLEDINKQKTELESKYQMEEDQLKEKLLQRESELAKVMKELEELQPMKELQRKQLLQIKELEEEVMATRGRHAEAMLKVKRDFLREKAQCQEDSEKSLNQLAQKAHDEAKKSILEVSSKVKVENQQLRQELLHLIRSARILQAQKQKLEEQNRQLEREQQCRKELGNVHHKFQKISLLPPE